MKRLLNQIWHNLKKLYCAMFGCWFLSNDKGIIRCDRCGAKFPVDKHENY